MMALFKFLFRVVDIKNNMSGPGLRVRIKTANEYKTRMFSLII
jgi:hypothetical protein